MKNIFDDVVSNGSSGVPILGAFPLYPPLELFDSMGLRPVVLWGMDRSSNETPAGDLRVQNFACSVARRLTEYVLSGRGASLAGLFAYNACDTLRNLPEILQDGLAETGRRIPFIKLHIPARPLDTDYATQYFRDEIERLIAEIERSFNVSFSTAGFVKSVEKFRAMRRLVLQMEELAASGRLSFAELAGAVADGAFQSVEDQIETYRRLIDRASAIGEGAVGVKVALSGILAPPDLVTKAILNAGLTIVGNDLAHIHRAHAYTPDSFEDAADYYTDFYKNHFPCPTLLASADRRIDAVLDLVKSSGARGFILIGEKFCEYEYFEYPYLERRLKGEGVHCLQIELAMGDIEINTTRIEAFAELLKQEEHK